MAQANKQPKNFIYEVMAPDGKTILEIQGPEGASEQQVLKAASELYTQQLQQRATTSDVPMISPSGQVEQIPSPPQPEQPSYSTMDYLKAAPEAALSFLTGATTGLIGEAKGFATQYGKELMGGTLGSAEAAQRIQQTAMQERQRATIAPQSPEAQQLMQNIAGASVDVPGIGKVSVSDLGALDPAIAGQLMQQMIGVQGVKRQQAATTEAAKAAQKAADKSLSAAQTQAAAQRRATAEMLGFKDESALTTGQATRNFDQLKFEKETAKLEAGQPLRERADNQTETLLRNFDALVNKLDPINVDPRELGKVVDSALVKRAEKKRQDIRKAYDIAQKTGAMEYPVTMGTLAERATDLTRFEGVSPNIKSIKNEAFRLGAIKSDENGNIIPGTISVNNSEILRQFVNEATDWTNPRESLFAKRFTTAIDEATEGAGGEAYKRARRLRSQFASEFENAALTSRLLSSKPGSDDRKVAFEDVFDKIIVMSPLEEMNKTRATLLKAGPEGKQAWKDLKAYGIQYIKDRSLSASQMDQRGNPIVSPDKLNKTISAMDRRGKLESLYGKRQAQTLRDLADISKDIYTAPPGAINFSNTASALQVALDSLATFGITGVPAPVATTLKEAAKYIKNRETRNRINAALEGR